VKSELPKPQPPKSEPPKPAEPKPTGDQLYRSAEAALARHDVDAADRALATLIANEPTSPLLAQALYDRARIAYDRHAWAAARHDLDALATIKDTPLAESGRYLTCRIAVEAHANVATRCLRDFRATYPRSPHDRDVLGTLAQLAHASGGCAVARTYIAELLQRYPHSTLATAWHDKCAEAK
jgi:outer membrane protein assembly factor BamD (BamD/ComL family)